MEQSYSSQTLDHLGLISGLIDEVGWVDLINTLLPSDAQQKIVSHGQALKGMLLNGLGFINQRLYLVSHFFADKPVSHLLGGDIAASHLNDDALGRTLDAIYGYGCSGFYNQLSLALLQHFGWFHATAHLDTSQFHVEGAYNSATHCQQDHVIHIRTGYSKDHRPDLNQAGLALIMQGRTQIPLLMQTLSGNASDTKVFEQMLSEHMGQLRQDYQVQRIVADSKLYTAEHIAALQDSRLGWITRVPATIAEVEQIWQYLDKGFINSVSAEQPYAICEVGSLYGQVAQRWAIIYSWQAYQNKQKTLNRHWLKASQQECQAAKRLERKSFACAEDAQNALHDFEKHLKYSQISHSSINSRQSAAKKQVYRLGLTLVCCLDKKEKMLQSQSFFILATNELDEQNLPALTVLEEYKEQTYLEKGFRFLKDPHIVASSFYVKKPERVEALLCLMSLCLLVYAALEYQLRQALQTQQQTLPNQVGKQVSNPTMRWIFSCFVGIHLLCIGQKQQAVLNLKEMHLIIVALLGPHYQKYYSIKKE